MRSLTAKVLVAFVAVAMLAVAVVAVLATRATDVAFAAYVHQGQTERLQRLQSTLADYYARYQSWSGVQLFLEQNTTPGFMMGGGMMGQARGVQGMQAGQQALVADAQGTIVAQTGAPHSGQRLSAREIAAALPLIVGGKTAGYVLGQGPGLSSFTTIEEQFIASVNRALALASLLAGGLAVILGLALARTLTAPLSSMTRAAQALARGDLSQRVSVQSQDEIGRLAQAFNSMASSLARAEELRRNLVADVAHELRTPVAVLRADLEALQDGIYQPTPERLAALREETDVLSRLVADLHELSLAEAGQLALERAPTDLSLLCRQAAAGMQSQAAARNVALLAGQVDEGTICLVDADRMGQVLRNLLSNALRYTPSGGSVTIDCRRRGDANLIAVRDTGTGIRPEDLPYIFDRFYRAEKSRSRATGGAGLGLAIVKQLVEAQGGQVWAESTPSQGATFYVRLPHTQV